MLLTAAPRALQGLVTLLLVLPARPIAALPQPMGSNVTYYLYGDVASPGIVHQQRAVEDFGRVAAEPTGAGGATLRVGSDSAFSAATDRATMVYMYCGPDPNQPNPGDPACNGRTAVALAHSDSITRLVVGSHRCRLPEFDAEAPEDWCDYADFSSNIHRLRNTGIEILLNAAGAHKFAGLPFVTGGAGVERMVELALSLNASGWALDLEAKGIALADYQAFFRKIKAAFEPHGLKLQYTAGHHFQNSNNFSALLPLVDYCFDMTTCE